MEKNDNQYWINYIVVLEELVEIRTKIPIYKKFFSAFDSLHKELFKELKSKKFTDEIVKAGKILEAQNEKQYKDLLYLELECFVNGYKNVTGSSQQKNPPVKKVTAKKMASVGNTILDSLIDAMQNVLPKWVIGLLKVLKEVIDIVAN